MIVSTDAPTIDGAVLGPTRTCAPVSGWRRTLADWLVVGGATAVCHALGAATSLLLRFLLGPAEMGVWQAVKLLLSYGNYANLGISKGAARELTIARGSGNMAAALQGLNLAFTVNTLTSLLYAAVLVGAGVWIGVRGDDGWSGGWPLGLIAAGLLAVLSRHVTFHVTILRSQQAFKVTSQLSILEAVLTLSAAVGATWCFGLIGLYAGTLTVLLGSLAFVVAYRGADLDWAWNLAEIRRLTVIGGPILLTGTVSSLFYSLDKLMILAYLSDREFQLGCYSLALMVTAQLLGLGNMFSTVMGPRYGETFGQSGSRREVARLAARASELQAAAMSLPGALAIVVAPPVLARMLPDYRAGLAPIVWLVPGAIALAVALPASQYLIAVARERTALAAVSLATCLAALGNHVALAGGHGLVGVAMATSAAYVAYWILVMGASLWRELAPRERLRYMAMLALTLGPALAVAIGLARTPSGSADPWFRLAVDVVIVAAVWSFSAALAWRVGGWQQQWREVPMTKHQ
ncbi:MAG: oligosaccharide flippase family protein [Planctomycetia bacterium]|nr:oligosaccharide flippase family protein [Planctomycetia bacterium]